MRKAEVLVSGIPAGYLEEAEKGSLYRFTYSQDYSGPPVSLTMPVRTEPFFDGLLPEGIQLDSLLRSRKIDKNDYFSQLIAVGSDMVGTVTVGETEA